MHEKQLIIDTNISETRIALLEKGSVASFYIERHRDQGMLGNIYLGTVSRVLPGMQSAFIDIGRSRSSFLFGGDVFDPELIKKIDALPDLFVEDDVAAIRRDIRHPIEKLIKAGQRIPVQVTKEPIGTKGARVTMYLSLPGRYLVYMPYLRHFGISKRIEDEDERLRLKDTIMPIKPENCGIIVRTAAKNVSQDLLERDLTELNTLWTEIEKRLAKSSRPTLVYQDLNLLSKTMRDLYTDEISKIVVNDHEAFDKLHGFFASNLPSALDKLELYVGRTPIFDVYGIEIDLGLALSKKVDLPSGGYMIIEQTEALTSFDINTGKYVGKASSRETILKTNLEAVDKLVDQLRVRNIGGIIVIDFIDMEYLDDRDEVYNNLLEALKQDKAKTNVLKISDLGLVQMTRKRTSPSLERCLMEKCPHCDGKGSTKTPATEALECIREIQRKHIQTNEVHIKVKARNDIRDWILTEERSLFNQVVHRHGIEVEFLPTKIQVSDLNEASFEVL